MVVAAASDCSRWFPTVFELLLSIWLLAKGLHLSRQLTGCPASR